MTTAISTTTHASPSARFVDLVPHAHWLPRIGFAAVFLFHGVGKLVLSRDTRNRHRGLAMRLR